MIFLVSAQASAFPVIPRSDIVQTEESALPIHKAIMTQDDQALIHRIGTERAESATNPHPDVSGINVRVNAEPGQAVTYTDVQGRLEFDMTTAYDVVAVVNKAADVQTLTLHKFRTVNGKRILVEKKVYPVSTGREKWACERGRNGKPEARWLGTPTGFYNPFYLHPDHYSKSYDDSKMSGAVFFNKLGIATHRGDISKARASHGCVRMSDEGSKALLEAALLSGGPVNPAAGQWGGTCPSPDSKDPATLAKCQANAAARGKFWRKWVSEKLQAGAPEGLPYSAAPEIPEIGKDGKLLRDEAGQIKMTTGYRMLYVVQCVTKSGKDCSSNPIPPKPRCLEGYFPPAPDFPEGSFERGMGNSAFTGSGGLY